MYDSFFLLGLNYKKADVIKRGRFSLQNDKILELLEYNRSKKLVNGCFCLSTCNRTEIYGFTSDIENLYHLICRFTHGTREELDKIHFSLQGKDAFRHLFRVSSGLESQVLGDFEIISQVKTLFSLAQKAGSLNAITDRMLNHAIECSKRIKNETKLSSGTASISYSAVQYILKHPSFKSNPKITLYGMGKIGTNTCQNLIKYIPNSKKNITLVVRNQERLKETLEKFQLNIQTQDSLTKTLNETDILIVATGANHPLITKENFPKDKKMIVIDLSIPCNVSQEISIQSQVSYIDIDQLNKSVSQSISTREKELPKAEKIIEENLSEFLTWVKSREDMTIMSQVKKYLSDQFEKEIKLLKKKHQSLDEAQANIISKTLLKKITQQLVLGTANDKKKLSVIKEIFDASRQTKAKSSTAQIKKEVMQDR